MSNALRAIVGLAVVATLSGASTTTALAATTSCNSLHGNHAGVPGRVISGFAIADGGLGAVLGPENSGAAQTCRSS